MGHKPETLIHTGLVSLKIAERRLRVPSRGILIGIVAGLVLLTIVAYWGVWKFEFVYFDDPGYVSNNLRIQHGLNRENFYWAFTAGDESNWHPLTWLSHMLDIQVYGMWSGGHHITNLLLHLANTLLMFFLLRSMTGTLWRSACVAALFAIHPMHVESVAWVAERKDLLSTLLGLAAIWAYVSYTRRGACQRHWIPAAAAAIFAALGATVALILWQKWQVHFAYVALPFLLLLAAVLAFDWRYGVVVVLFALGLMAKPMLVTLPCVLLLLDYWPLRRFPQWGAAGDGIPVAGFAESGKLLPKDAAQAPVSPWFAWLWLLLEKLPLLLLSAASSVVTYCVQQAGGSVIPENILPLGVRLGTTLISYMRYLGMLFWPTRMAVYYPRPMNLDPSASQEMHLEWGPFWLAVPLLLAITVVTLVAAWRGRRYVLMGWLWFLGILVPVIGFVQVGEQLMADRYAYVSYVGIFIILVWGAFDLLGRWPWGRIALAAVAGVAILTCVVLTFIQSRYWMSSENLLVHALDMYPHNAHMHNNLGVLRWEQGQHAKEDAQREYEEAQRAQQLGHHDEAQKHMDEAKKLSDDVPKRFSEAVTRWQEAVHLRPGFAGAYSNLGYAALQTGNVDEAIQRFSQAIQCNPQHAEAYNNIGLALWRKDPGNIKKAIGCFQQALVYRPDYLDPHINLVLVYCQLQDWDQVERELKTLLYLTPKRPNTIRNLGTLLWQRGKVAEALDLLQNGVQRFPTDLLLVNQLAWILATNSDSRFCDGPQAVRLAQRAINLPEGKSPVILDTLAAAYARAGRLADAVQAAELAQQAARSQGNGPLVEKLNARLAVYRQGKPYGDPQTGPTPISNP